MAEQIAGTDAMALLALGAGAVLFVLAALLKRWTGWTWVLVATGFVWSLVVVAVVTLVPLDGVDLVRPAESRSDTCSFDYGGPAPDGFWIFGGTQRMLNTALFVPAGALMVLTLARWRGWWALLPFGLAALATYSVGLELVQLEVARIGRACDVTDMADNVMGAGLGVLLGILLLPILGPMLRRRRTAGRG